MKFSSTENKRHGEIRISMVPPWKPLRHVVLRLRVTYVCFISHNSFHGDATVLIEVE
jgi:hypothetical protein